MRRWTRRSWSCPAEAEAVRTIFERYLDLGSVRTLADDLDHRGIRSKPRQLSNGRLIGGGAFGVGALAYLLKNRFYIGEVVYRGEVHRGDHAPILDRPLFEAVQAKLAVQTVARRCRLRGSPALLTGRLFDDRGHRMSPSHTNKGGVRYRYYVSQALLQSKSRAPARSAGCRRPRSRRSSSPHCADTCRRAAAEPQPIADSDRDLIERHVERITLTPRHIKLQMRQPDAADAVTVPEDAGHNAIEDLRVATITIPWTGPMPAAVKGIVHVPAHNTPIKPARRETLLTAIAKARQWVDDMAQGRTATFAQIARREGKVERHVRLLAPLAFLSPRIVAAIIDGTAPADLTATCSPARCPIPGPSRSGGSELDQSARRQQAYTRLEKSRFARREQEGGNHRTTRMGEDDRPLSVITGDRKTRERRAGRRRALDQNEQITCWRCENDTGVATSMAVRVMLAPRRTPLGRLVAGTEGWICTHCLSRGQITSLTRF